METAPIPRIYADFNGLVRGVTRPDRTAVVLDTYGSLRDLAHAGLILREGLPLIAVDASDDEEDLEGHGTAHYDHDQQCWVVEFDALGVRYVPAGDRSQTHPLVCVQCKRPFHGAWPGSGGIVSGPQRSCEACGTAMLAPFAPPVR